VYDVEGCNPVLEYVEVFAVTTAISSNAPVPVFRSILNPVSLFELSVQDRDILLADSY
jgi:hypothetical protein